MHELVVLGNDPDAAEATAAEVGGISYIADSADPRDLPFRAMVRAMTEDLDSLLPAAGVGTYLIFSRTIRERPEPTVPGRASTGVTAVFPLIGHPDLDHRAADAHWRDTHAPLALLHHPGMWDYTQCSVVRTLDGPEFDGFALCAFASRKDLQERFFADEEGRAIIRADVASFADTVRSPRRVVTTETIHSRRPPIPDRTWPHD